MNERLLELAERIGQKYQEDPREVLSKLRLLVETFKIPEDEAVRAVVNNILKNRAAERKGIDARIGELRSMDDGDLVNVEVRVLAVLKGEGKRPNAAIVGDETGVCRLAWWERKGIEVKLEKGKCYRIANAVVDRFGDRPGLRLTAASEVAEIQRDIRPREATEEFLGVVVDVPKSCGLIPVCPECGRHSPKKTCPQHGSVKPEFDFRIRLVLDNGEEAVYASFRGEMAERVAGMSRAEAVELAKREMRLEAVRERVEEALFGKYLKVKGTRIRDSILVAEFEFARPSPEIVEEEIDLSQLVGEVEGKEKKEEKEVKKAEKMKETEKKEAEKTKGKGAEDRARTEAKAKVDVKATGAKTEATAEKRAAAEKKPAETPAPAKKTDVLEDELGVLEKVLEEEDDFEREIEEDVSRLLEEDEESEESNETEEKGEEGKGKSGKAGKTRAWQTDDEARELLDLIDGKGW